jgi:predicted Zn-dependent peptidase
MPDAATVTVLVMVEAGSRYETKEINGVSHFLEHMCFKGTTNRPRLIDISRELDSIGASYNAYTSTEYTGYYAKSAAKHYGKILDIVSDIYLNPILDEKEIEKEKGTVIEEINMYEDQPADLLPNVLDELLYGDQPVGRTILGTKESVQMLKRDDIFDYRSRQYVASGTTLIIAGCFEEKQAFKDVAEKFADISIAKKGTAPKVKEKQSEPGIRFRRKESEQTHIAIGVRAFSLFDKRAMALRMLNVVLSGGMSSRLFQKIRDEMGVAYYVYSYPTLRTDHGDFTIYAGIDNNRVPEVADAVMNELRKLKFELVSDEELKKAKDYYAGQMALGLESTDEWASYYGGQEILHREIKKPIDIAKELNAVTAHDIRAVAKQLFIDKKLNFALIGRYKNEKIIKKLLKF